MRHITHEQWRKLSTMIGPSLRLFGKLRTRLERLGTRGDDPYYLRVCKAYDAVHAVSVWTHYASCESGVGESVPKNDPMLWLGDGI